MLKNIFTPKRAGSTDKHNRYQTIWWTMSFLLIACCGSGQPSSTDPVAILSALHDNMVLVEGGNYKFPRILDRTAPELSYIEGELPDFHIGKFEVTQKEWRAVMGEDPANLNNVGMDDNPVEMVNWDEIQVFISKLTEVTGLNYRLPTNVEWEFAARGGTKSKHYKYSGTNGPAHHAVWHGGNIPMENHNEKKYTMPVGKLTPNELGLYDMSGNVWEWTESCGKYGPVGSTHFNEGESYTSEEQCDYRITRGGGALGWIYNCDLAVEKIRIRMERKPTLGFRLVLD